MSNYKPAKKYPCIDCGHVSARKDHRCSACSAENIAKRAEAYRAAKRAERPAESQAFCIDCPPGKTPIRGNAKRCRYHAKEHELKRKRADAKTRWQRDKARIVAAKAGEEHIRPHRAKKVEREPAMTEEEREALDAKQRLIDLQLQAKENEHTAKILGLRYEPGKPLASTVKHLSRAEIARIAATLTPPKRTKELPHYVL